MFKVTSSVLRFAYNIKSKFLKNLTLRTGYLISKECDNNETWLKYEQGLGMFDRKLELQKVKTFFKII